MTEIFAVGEAAIGESGIGQEYLYRNCESWTTASNNSSTILLDLLAASNSHAMYNQSGNQVGSVTKFNIYLGNNDADIIFDDFLFE